MGETGALHSLLSQTGKYDRNMLRIPALTRFISCTFDRRAQHTYPNSPGVFVCEISDIVGRPRISDFTR